MSKGVNSLRKEMERLLNKRISNIYLKVTKKNWLNFRNLSPGQFLGSSNSRRHQKSCCSLKIRGLGAKLCVAHTILILKGIMTF